MAIKDIIPNDKNWRRHPKAQKDAMRGVLEEVGWAQQVVVNERTGNLVDGHLRLELAEEAGQKTIKVTTVDMTREEELKVLATMDPIGAMASRDRERLGNLLEGIETRNEAVRNLLDEMIGINESKLTATLQDEKEIQVAGRGAQEIIGSLSEKIRKIAAENPKGLNEAICVVVPNGRGNDVLILADPNAADIVRELKRYADAGERSPLEALMRATAT